MINCYALRLADLQCPDTHGRLQSMWTVYLLMDRFVVDANEGQKDVPCFRRIGIGCDEKTKADRVFTRTDRQDIALY